MRSLSLCIYTSLIVMCVSKAPLRFPPIPGMRDPLKTLDNNPEEKLGVLLLNLGGPEKEKDVVGFLYNLFADPDIIRLPGILSLLQKPLAYAIAKRRSPKSEEAYRSIGGGSPINNYTRAQAKGISDELIRRGFKGAKCYVGMRYWTPYTQKALDDIKRDGISNLVVLPLYPHYSISTTGSSLKEVDSLFTSDPAYWFQGKIRHTVVPHWFTRPGYIDAMADLVLQQYHNFTAEQQRAGVDILFSAHGVPKSYIEAGDPYQSHIRCCAALISLSVRRKLLENQASSSSGWLSLWRKKIQVDVKLPGDTSPFPPSRRDRESLNIRCRLSFQSRVGPVEWLRPYTDDTLRDMGRREKVQNIIVVPISFVSEHIETLEEIDMEYKALALESGIQNWRRASALNTNERFIQDLANVVEAAATGPTLTVSEALDKMQPNDRKRQATRKQIAKFFIATVAASLFSGPIIKKWKEH